MIASLLVALIVLLVAAKLGGAVAEWLGQPAVLGELLAGVLLSALPLAGIQGLYRLVKEKSAEIDALQHRHDELEDRLSKLETLAHQISDRLDHGTANHPAR